MTTLAVAGALALATPGIASAGQSDPASGQGGSTEVTIISTEEPEPTSVEQRPLAQTGVASPSALLGGIVIGSAAVFLLLRPRS